MKTYSYKNIKDVYSPLKQISFEKVLFGVFFKTVNGFMMKLTEVVNGGIG